ncbi:MAG: tetratricopeptide repeat protein [Saprospiraceae bacterium]|nr:tetratricopeptide repeat protein [Saprospiraceae bacterium]
MKKSLLLVILAVMSIQIGWTQSPQKSRLANEYYNSGEYEKASVLYQELYQESNRNKSYFNLYIQCLIEMSAFDKASMVIQEEIKRSPGDVSLYVSSGNLLERKYEPEKAMKEYRKAIDNITPDPTAISNLGNAFINLSKFDLAIETFEKGQKLSNIENLYVYNLADLYRRVGDEKNMIRYYLLAAEKDANTSNIQTSLQRFLGEDDYEELQSQLYKKIQEKPSVYQFAELLQWSFVHKKEYGKALRQARAIDRQLDENGSRVFNLADIAFKDKDYDTAIEAYNYIITSKGKNTAYYLESKRQLLNSKKAKVIDNYNYTKTDLLELKNAYVGFLSELGRNTQTAQLMQEYAEFEGFYMNELDTAILVLEELRNFGGLRKEVVAKAKLTLGDFYLMNGERWEASLLFSQVDKDFKEGVLGEEARYRNAKLSYYAGDFEWSQEQFKILKGATSNLISNDAIDMSVFIMDNLGLDTTEVTLQMYAQADLYIFQNRFDEALIKLDSIKILFPEHSLEDDVLYSKAQIFKKQRKTEDAIRMYETIIEKFPEEIRADNALFELADIYQTKLNMPEKAQELFEKLFLDYSGSTFAVEARQRFRRLRGDEI